MAATGMIVAGGVVPDFPVGVTLETSSLYNIWAQALKKQEPSTRSTRPDIGTLISPSMMGNLVPMDGPHPLYTDKYANLRTQILKDYMIEEKVRPDDARMSQPNGLTVTNFNGKKLTFKKDDEGKMSVEGHVLEGVETLEGGIVSYAITELFDGHQARVNQALEVMRNEEPDDGPFRTECDMCDAPQPPQ